MRRFYRAAGAFALAALLSACAGSMPAEQLADLADVQAPAADDADRGAAQKIADKLLGEAQGVDQRSLRLCMILTGVSEVMADRVTRFDSDYAPTALGQLATLKGVQARFDGAAGGVFFETDIQLALLELTSILVEVGKDRVPRLLANFAGAVNPFGIAERARVAGRQAAIADAVIRDTRALLKAVANNEISSEDARAQCGGRMDRNYNRIATMLGGL